MLAHMLRYSKV